MADDQIDPEVSTDNTDPEPEIPTYQADPVPDIVDPSTVQQAEYLIVRGDGG